MVLLLSISFEKDALFYAGETFTCFITLSNPLDSSNDPHSPPSLSSRSKTEPDKRTWVSFPPIQSSMGGDRRQESSETSPENPLDNGTSSFRGLLGATFSFFTGKSNGIPRIPEDSEMETAPFKSRNILPEKARNRNLKLNNVQERKLFDATSSRSDKTLLKSPSSSQLAKSMTDVSRVIIRRKSQQGEDFGGSKQDTLTHKATQEGAQVIHLVDRDSSSHVAESHDLILAQTPSESSKMASPISKRHIPPSNNRHRALSNPKSEGGASSFGGLSDSMSNYTLDSGIPLNPRNENEDLAWVFVQMMGNFTFDSSIVKEELFESLGSKPAYRMEGGVGGSMVGGGSMSHLDGKSSPLLGPKSVLKSHPLYSVPPSLLGTNLSLKPGESKTYRYDIKIPSVLPPSFTGRTVRFSYRLIVGIQRMDMKRRSQVIRLPFRLFNRTHGDGSRPVYEMLNPVIVTQDEAKVSNMDRELDPRTIHHPKAFHESSLETSNSLLTLQNLFQTSQKVCFDICKNNEFIAQLTLLRGSFKLGESIIGILTFEKSSIPCFQISAFLETTESLDQPFSSRPKSQVAKLTKRIHSEFHKYTLNIKRTHILLSIPHSACPDFQTTAFQLQWAIRFEFVTGNTQDLYKKSVNGDGNFLHYRCLSVLPADSFSCVVPVKVYGIRTDVRQGKTCRFEIL